MNTSDTSDPYAVLGLQRDATAAQIGAAFRDQAKLHHPDKHAAKSDAERHAHAEQFRRARWAYDLLADADQRAYYDAHGCTREAAASSPTPASAVDRTLRAAFLKVTSGFAARDFTSTDLIYHMRLHVTDERIALRTDIARLTHAGEEMRRFEGRFLRDEKADNTIAHLLAEQHAQLAALIASKTAEAEHLKDCLDELQHWRFVRDGEEAAPPAAAAPQLPSRRARRKK